MKGKKEIVAFFEDEYLRGGFMYSGCWPWGATAFSDEGTREHIYELIEEGRLEIRDCESRSIQLPKERRRELIEEHGLAEKWQEEHPEFYPNGAYGEVSKVYDRTQQILKEQVLWSLHRNTNGWFAYFMSKSGKGNHKTQLWTRDYKQFKKGMITCNCPGWRFRRKCRHQDEMRDLVVKAEISIDVGLST